MEHTIALIPRALAAFALWLGSAALARSAAGRLRLPLAARFAATLTLLMWGATMAFHVLLRLEAFHLPGAFAALIASAAALYPFGVRAAHG
ncbi:MAG: hypothetical protein K8I02_10035, partial [Candidatus Methylomirabilis sp.]|nr:hypothetical protein [Deltaproteobacteria bacterium]